MKNEKSLFDQTNDIVKGIAKKCSITNNNTGNTYFINPKQRLCKVVLTKKNVKLECNIEVSKELKDKINSSQSSEIIDIDKDTAKKKKLGTMKNMLISSNTEFIKDIIEDMLKTWNS